jgi:hypothetical protein
MALEAPNISSPEVNNLYDICTICSFGKVSQVETVKYLVNQNYSILAFFFLVGLFSTAAMQAYCTLTPPMEYYHSSPEALHTKQRERPLLAKDGTKTEKGI